jgi:hypothetical protein
MHKILGSIFCSSGEMDMGKLMGIMLLPSVLPWQTKKSSKNLFMLMTGRLLTSEMTLTSMMKKVPTKVNEFRNVSNIFIEPQKKFVL